MRVYPKNLLGSFFNLLLPPICPLCKNSLEGAGLCDACLSGLKMITGPLCSVCGMPFVSKTGENRSCAECIAGKIPFVKARSAVYYDKEAVKAIHRFKYNGDFSFTRAFGLLLMDAYDSLGETGFNAIIPVPLHDTRLKQRGFNQSLLIAKELAKKIGAEVDYLRLVRTRHTPPQVNLKEKERIANVKGAFAIENPSAFKGKKALLVDDVYTTGATIRECSKVLKKSGAEVFVLTVARVAKV
ncbi:MAG: ComF family protein [Thermodesulfobacteriota bacterium]